LLEYRVTWRDRYSCTDRIVQFGGQRFRCHAKDLAAVRFLLRLELDRMAPAGDQAAPPALLSLRDDFRRLIADQPMAGLVGCLGLGSDETRRLAIWLLGQCGSSLAIPALCLFATRRRRDLRVAMVRALRRLRARAELREIAGRDEDPWIRQYAAAATERTFHSHLQQFLREDAKRVTRGEHQVPARMPLVWNLTELSGPRPKSTDLIRAILERIRSLLRGNGMEKPSG
jgi:hypothetical protein